MVCRLFLGILLMGITVPSTASVTCEIALMSHLKGPAAPPIDRANVIAALEEVFGEEGSAYSTWGVLTTPDSDRNGTYGAARHSFHPRSGDFSLTLYHSDLSREFDFMAQEGDDTVHSFCKLPESLTVEVRSLDRKTIRRLVVHLNDLGGPKKIDLWEGTGRWWGYSWTGVRFTPEDAIDGEDF